MFLAATILLLLLFPHEGRFKYDFLEGKPWKYEDLIAPFDFPIKKIEGQVEIEKEKIYKSQKLYFRFNEEAVKKSKEHLQNLFGQLWTVKHTDNKTNYLDFERNWNFSKNILDTIYARGILKYDKAIIHKGAGTDVFLIHGNIAEKIAFNRLLSLNKAADFIDQALLFSDPELIDKRLVSNALKKSLTYNVVFDFKLTSEDLSNRLRSVSLVTGLIQKGEIIVSRGELITPEKLLILESLKQEYKEQLGGAGRYYMIIAGQLLLILISLTVLFLYFASFWLKDYANNKKVLFILIIIYLMVLATSLVVRLNIDLLFVIPLCLVPIIIRVFFDTRLALFIHIVTIIFIGFLVPNSFHFIFMQLIAGIIAIVSIVDIKRRSQFVTTSFLIFITYSAIHVGLLLIQEASLSVIHYQDFMYFGVSALLTLISYPLIFIFEKSFGFLTDITLMEISDTNHKLLRELSFKAPGTFQHVLQVSNIAEEVIRHIGGNPLLMRAGALYHDIGKMENPHYFIENLRSDINPHDALNYKDSAKLIISHVEKGVEIARKHKIPERVIDFIRTHHGTSTTQYFYHKFLKENPEIESEKSLFTYPGPIPFSKETAVLMIADSVEAASRSLHNPDEQKINDLVENIINGQIANHQFANADITFKDLSIIKRVCKKMLINIYHVRIAYPDTE